MNPRISQLSGVVAVLAGVPEKTAVRMILNTAVGQEISRGNPAFLYDQPTANLYAIAAEFSPELRSVFTAEAIRDGFRKSYRSKSHSPGIIIAQEPDLLEPYRSFLKASQQQRIRSRFPGMLRTQRRRKIRSNAGIIKDERRKAAHQRRI